MIGGGSVTQQRGDVRLFGLVIPQPSETQDAFMERIQQGGIINEPSYTPIATYRFVYGFIQALAKRVSIDMQKVVERIYDPFSEFYLDGKQGICGSTEKHEQEYQAFVLNYLRNALSSEGWKEQMGLGITKYTNYPELGRGYWLDQYASVLNDTRPAA